MGKDISEPAGIIKNYELRETRLSIKTLILGMVMLTVLGSCSNLDSHSEPVENISDPRYQDEEHVIVQVCRPNKTVAFENVKVDLKGTTREPGDNSKIAPISPDQGDNAIIRKWAAGSPADAAVSEMILADVKVIYPSHSPYRTFGWEAHPLIGNTVKNQPVYEEDLRARQKDVVALAVRSNREYPDNVNYWFTLPKIIPHNEFTEWQEPISQENKADQIGKPSMEWELKEGKTLPNYPVESANAPKMRFKIMTVRDYTESNRFWKREIEAIANEYFRGFQPIKKIDDNLLFAPVLTEAIPNCESTLSHERR